MFPYLLNELGLFGVGVEIGVQEGMFSEHLLSFWKGRLLYSVDPWRAFPESVYNDIANVSQAEHDQFYIETLRRLAPFEYRSVIWRLASKDAVELVSDGDYDFGSFGVRRAVSEYTRRTGQTLVVSAEPEDKFPSWFVMKR